MGGRFQTFGCLEGYIRYIYLFNEVICQTCNYCCYIDLSKDNDQTSEKELKENI